LGTTFDPEWLIGNFGSGYGFMGVSNHARGEAGGNSPQAKLSASVSGDGIVISWSPTGGTLQSSPSLGVGEAWSTVGTTNPATVRVSGNAKFFRVVPATLPPLNIFGSPTGIQSGFNLFNTGTLPVSPVYP
jgi:hypothetical protein